MAKGGDVDGSWMKAMSLQYLALQKDFKASAHWSLTLTLILERLVYGTAHERDNLIHLWRWCPLGPVWLVILSSSVLLHYIELCYMSRSTGVHPSEKDPTRAWWITNGRTCAYRTIGLLTWPCTRGYMETPDFKWLWDGWSDVTGEQWVRAVYENKLYLSQLKLPSQSKTIIF